MTYHEAFAAAAYKLQADPTKYISLRNQAQIATWKWFNERFDDQLTYRQAGRPNDNAAQA